MVNGYTEV